MDFLNCINSEAHIFSDLVGGDYTLSSNYYMLLILRSQDVCVTQEMKGEWLTMTLENYPYENIQGHQVWWIFTSRLQTSTELSSVGFWGLTISFRGMRLTFAHFYYTI